jgi:hypothetical protein
LVPIVMTRCRCGFFLGVADGHTSSSLPDFRLPRESAPCGAKRVAFADENRCSGWNRLDSASED